MVQHRGRSSSSRAEPLSPRRRKKRNLRLPAAAIAVVLIAGGLGASRLLGHDSGPLAPHGLTAVDTAPEMVALAWKPVAKADTYEVIVASNPDMTKHRTYYSKTAKVQIPDLKESTEYFVKVRGVDVTASDSENPGDYSSVKAVTTKKSIPPALVIPTGLRVTESTSSKIGLSWDPIAKATGYQVEFSSDKSFKNPRKIEAGDASATVDGLDADRQFYARLSAHGTDNKSGKLSAVLSVRTIVPTDELPLRVASFNVRCHSCGGSWSARRTTVASTIAHQSPDVIGLQEAAQSRPRGLGHSQFEDIRALTSADGSAYAITQPSIGASQGTRIMFKPSTVVLLDAGSVRYSSQKRGQNPRYLAWAIFRQRDTGQRFMFVSTHLQPGKDGAATSARNAQARQLISTVGSINSQKYPVFIVGDMNDFQYSSFYVQPLMHQAGYIDPLGVQNRSRVPAPWSTVEKRIHANYDSFNDNKRHVNIGPYNPEQNGTYLDYIFMSPMKRVMSFENVVDMDAQGNFRGVIPSDHNMIRTDVVLPY